MKFCRVWCSVAVQGVEGQGGWRLKEGVGDIMEWLWWSRKNTNGGVKVVVGAAVGRGNAAETLTAGVSRPITSASAFLYHLFLGVACRRNLLFYVAFDVSTTK